MPANRNTTTIGVCVVVALASGLAVTAPAIASKPVPKAIAGCVLNGSFVSSDGYNIRPRYGNGQALDLRPFEGLALTIDGELLPGDAFIVNKLPRDSGPCKMTQPFQPAAAAETVKVTTSTWRINKPSREFKDLPTLLPKEQNGFEVGIGQFEFVCLKSAYYILLVQPSVKLRDTEQGSIAMRAANAAGGAAPTPLTFRNLYKTKSLLSRSLNRDADIHYAGISAALLASIGAMSDLELTLADRSYAIALADLGSRLGSFRRFCETGLIDDPAHFDEP